MIEDEARAWIADRFAAPAVGRLERLVAAVLSESSRQNLISPTTIDRIWSRHVVDSLQLCGFAPKGDWIDIGTGAGFPGLAVAAVEPERPMMLVEPRKLRASFLQGTAEALGLPHVAVRATKVEGITARAAVLSARAVASLDKLFASAWHLADNETVWILPKGTRAQEELANARRNWHGVFHVEQSLTDPDASIVVARGVRPRR